MRRELDVEALGELRDPRELVRARRDDGAAQALEAALEVHVRPVALEVARAGQDEVGPAGDRRAEHRDREHPLGPLGERADVRVRGGLVAGHDQELDRLRIGLVAVGGRCPAVGDAAAVRRLGEVERAAARLPGEAELGGERRRSSRRRFRSGPTR